MDDDTPCENILERLFDCVQSGIEWGSEKFKSAWPCRKEKPKRRCRWRKIEDDDIGPPCTEERSKYILPSQICPKISCYIKMQDPYAPCCCKPKSKSPLCPPKCYRRQRERTCICDLCKKNIDNKCCRPFAAFRATCNSKFEG